MPGWRLPSPSTQSFTSSTWSTLATSSTAMRSQYWRREDLTPSGRKISLHGEVSCSSSTYREVEKKVNLTWHENGTISYRRVKFWYFEREMSVGPLTDMVTTINVPVVGSAEFVRGDFFMEWGISDMLSTIEVRVKLTDLDNSLLRSGQNICKENYWRASLRWLRGHRHGDW